MPLSGLIPSTRTSEFQRLTPVALQYLPNVGEIFMCEFPECFRAPEMVKHRPVIVVSPFLPGRSRLVNVVPISMTAPSPVQPYHCRIATGLLPRPLQEEAGERWAKCDMVYTLCIDRLSLVRGARSRAAGGKRSYHTGRLDLAHLQAVRRAIAAGMGIGPELFGALAAPAITSVDEAERDASNS